MRKGPNQQKKLKVNLNSGGLFLLPGASIPWKIICDWGCHPFAVLRLVVPLFPWSCYFPRSRRRKCWSTADTGNFPRNFQWSHTGCSKVPEHVPSLMKDWPRGKWTAKNYFCIFAFFAFFGFFYFFIFFFFK